MSEPLTRKPRPASSGSSRKRQLDVFFFPKSVAVIGATDRPGHIGRTVLWNLIANTSGRAIYPVNPNKAVVFGTRTYPNIGSVPETVELAVVITPAETVPGVIKECGE